MEDLEPIIVNLQDRGQQVLLGIELYDESILGAGQLTYNGRYKDISEVKSAIEKVLENSPIEEEGKAKSPLSVNRFNSNNAWGYREHNIVDPYPNRSRYLVHFVLNFDFGNDYCMIDLGINWAPFQLANGDLNSDYPLGERKFGDKINLEDLKILRVTLCTVDDAEILVKELGLKDPRNLEVVDVTKEITQDQLDALETEEDELLLTTKIAGEDYILVNKNKILSVKESDVVKSE